jgi:predicted alpha/beta hydrolase
MHESQSQTEDMTITTRDGVALAATLHTPLTPGSIRAGVLISSGTGYPKEFYDRFAAYGATRGFACLVYDYRGIAGSAPEDMRTCNADFFTWGTKDAPAALDALVSKLDGLPVFTLGHSFGGQLVGLMDNHRLARGHALIAVGNGHWLQHHATEWWLEFLFFYILGPLSLARHGYLKGPDFWPGANMPAALFRQWKRWCLSPGYYWNDVQNQLGGAHFEMHGAPMCQFAFSDDPVVNPKSEPFTRQCYKGATYETRWINPADLGVEKIGHSGAFSRKAAAFWPLPFDWFETLL